LAELAQILVRNHLGIIQHIYLAADSQRDMEQHLAEQIKAAREEGVPVPEGNHGIQVHGVRNLSELLNLLWEDIGVTA
jgi:hypothetical protein